MIDPIGFVHSPYIRKYDAPRQPGADDRQDHAFIRLHPHRNFEQALKDLAEGYERRFRRATEGTPSELR